MARPPARIELSAEEESVLREWIRKGTSEQRLVDRARIILLSHEGSLGRQSSYDLDVLLQGV